MLRTAIVGAAGYTAGELIRLVINHPELELSTLQSNSQAGKKIHQVHHDLLGWSDLTFEAALDTHYDVVFICAGHGKAKTALEAGVIPDHDYLIDLSRDFRLKEDKEWKGKSFVYGLPEINRDQIAKTTNIANPGCFATAIQLALLPMAKAGELEESIHVHAITGSTGAGQNPGNTTHFSWRNDNVSVYKAFNHQHLGEIHQSMRQLDPSFAQKIWFVPVRGAFSRGIFASAHFQSQLSAEQIKEIYHQYYIDEPFVQIVDEGLHLKMVTNTNMAYLQVKKIDDQVLVHSVIDNLLKGASGQAIQNLNIMKGWEETLGLRLKSNAF